MKERLAIALALAALVVAALGSTSLGQAATGAARASVDKARSSKLAGPLRVKASEVRRGPRGKRGKRGPRGLRGLAGPPGGQGAQGVPGPSRSDHGQPPGRRHAARELFGCDRPAITAFAADSITFNLPGCRCHRSAHYINVEPRLCLQSARARWRIHRPPLVTSVSTRATPRTRRIGHVSQRRRLGRKHWVRLARRSRDPTTRLRQVRPTSGQLGGHRRKA